MRMLLKDGKNKVVTLSYDDGVVQDIRLSEIAKKYGLKITFNISSGRYLEEETKRDEFYGRMKLSEAKSIYLDSGNEVAIHGYTHSFLNLLSDNEIIFEICEDRKNIEKQYNSISRGMAYPYGAYNDRVIDILKKCGIVYSRTVKSTHSFAFPENWLELNPTCRHNDPMLMELVEKFICGDRYGRNTMFFLWGHSYEFDNDDNWNIIEKFCERIGNRDDIWYATNIEIYDYVEAYNRLQTSFDSKIIKNPSSIDVWATDNSGDFCIKAGETLFR